MAKLPAVDLGDLKKEYDEIAPGALKCVTEGNAKDIQERLYRMIDYGIGRFDWYENQRHKFLGIALITLPILAAQTSYSLGLFDSHILSSIFGIISALVGFVVAGTLILIYVSGTEAPHPYRKLADIRSWYFRYNLPGELRSRLDSDPDKAKEQIRSVVSAYKEFCRRWADLADRKNGFLDEDLQQVFILQLLQKHRRENLNYMVSCLKIGSIIYIVFIVATILAYPFK